MRVLIKEDGSRCTTDDEMRQMAASFYEKLFTSEGSIEADRLLNHIQEVVSDEMNSKLMAMVTDVELETALF